MSKPWQYDKIGKLANAQKPRELAFISGVLLPMFTSSLYVVNIPDDKFSPYDVEIASIRTSASLKVELEEGTTQTKWTHSLHQMQPHWPYGVNTILERKSKEGRFDLFLRYNSNWVSFCAVTPEFATSCGRFVGISGVADIEDTSNLVRSVPWTSITGSRPGYVYGIQLNEHMLYDDWRLLKLYVDRRLGVSQKQKATEM